MAKAVLTKYERVEAAGRTGRDVVRSAVDSCGKRSG